MISVLIGNNVERLRKTFSVDTTLRAAFEEVEIDYTRGQINLDGATLKAGDINKTFSDFGITETCSLTVTTKLDNAMF